MEETTVIYAIEAVGSGRVKFGRAGNPEERLKVLSTGSAYPLKLLASLDWPDEVEPMIHQAFSNRRVSGEWFAMSPEVEEFVEALIIPDAFIDRHSVCMAILSDVCPSSREAGPYTNAEKQKRYRERNKDKDRETSKLRMRKMREKRRQADSMFVTETER